MVLTEKRNLNVPHDIVVVLQITFTTSATGDYVSYTETRGMSRAALCET